MLLFGDHDRLNPPKTIEQVKQMIPHIEAEIIAYLVIYSLWSSRNSWTHES
jgi:hypothetical protein